MFEFRSAVILIINATLGDKIRLPTLLIKTPQIDPIIFFLINHIDNINATLYADRIIALCINVAFTTKTFEMKELFWLVEPKPF